MLDLLIVVTARGGSKRLQGKNTRKLAGKSLLHHTADAIDAAGLGAPVVLSTDDDAAAREGTDLGWQVPFRRPAELAGDMASLVDVVLHVLDHIRSAEGQDPCAVMLLQPTSPLRGHEVLRAAVDRLTRPPEVDGVIAVRPLGLPPHLVFTGDAESGLLVAPNPGPVGAVPAETYVPNGALYLIRSPRLRETRSFFGGRIAGVALDPVRSIDIDTEQDFRLAECAWNAGVPLGPPSVLGT